MLAGPIAMGRTVQAVWPKNQWLTPKCYAEPKWHCPGRETPVGSWSEARCPQWHQAEKQRALGEEMKIPPVHCAKLRKCLWHVDAAWRAYAVWSMRHTVLEGVRPPLRNAAPKSLIPRLGHCSNLGSLGRRQVCCIIVKLALRRTKLELSLPHRGNGQFMLLIMPDRSGNNRRLNGKAKRSCVAIKPNPTPKPTRANMIGQLMIVGGLRPCEGIAKLLGIRKNQRKMLMLQNFIRALCSDHRRLQCCCNLKCFNTCKPIIVSESSRFPPLLHDWQGGLMVTMRLV